MSSDEPKKAKIRYLDPNYDRAKRSRKQEQRVADRLGGRRLPANGAKSISRWSTSKVLNTNPTQKGDLSCREFHIEHKRTETDTMSIKREWVRKVSEGARFAGKDPAVIVTFEKRGMPEEDWVLVPIAVFERMRDAEAKEGPRGPSSDV